MPECPIECLDVQTVIVFEMKISYNAEKRLDVQTVIVFRREKQRVL